MQDKMRKGRHRGPPPPTHYGEDHPQAKLTWKEVDEIRSLYASGEYNLRELAEQIPLVLDLEERDAMYREMSRLNRELHESVPLFYMPFLMAINNDTVSPVGWTRSTNTYFYNFEYVRHAEPLNTFRLFELD